MKRPVTFCLILIFFGLLLSGLVFSSCREITEQNWTEAIPAKNPFIIIPSEQTTLNSVLKSSYIPFLDDITSSAIPLVSRVDTLATSSLPVNAIMLYPGTDNQLQPIWVTEAPNNYAKKLKGIFSELFAQNEYTFHDVVIQVLHLHDRNIYAAQLHKTLLISESSLGIEDAIRSYLGVNPSVDLSPLEPQPSTILMNTSSLDKWIEQLAKVIYRPHIKNSFNGTKPTLLHISDIDADNHTGRSFKAEIPLTEEPGSILVSAFSNNNAPIELDRYISSNAAAFAIFRLPPRLAPPTSVPNPTPLDSVLMADKVRYSKFAKSMDNPFALVAYSESGFLSEGEHLFLRKLSDRSAFQQEVTELVRDGLAQTSDGVYYIQSKVLGKLIGSKLNTFGDFYLNITGEVVVISKRKGLAEAVSSDRSRRRVIYYEENYMNIKQDQADEVSGLAVVNPEFRSFINPFVAPESYMDVVLSKFDMMMLSTRLDSTGNKLSMDLNTYQTDQQTNPYREKWLFPTDGAELTGRPIMADIVGSSNEEVIFSTESGTIYALATDGTVILQTSTGDDVPVGSPVVYDWYGNNQNIILMAAGNKIYGWNDTGTLLPKFPFELNEKITTPLTVSDLDRDGLPDALVGTADRKLHALDGRGIDLEGWPVTSNSIIETKPVIDYFRGEYSVTAFSENAIHNWLPDGLTRGDFPKFVNASLNGSPVLYKENILAGAADGHLYSIGNNTLFSDSLNVYSNTTDSTGIAGVYVSNSSLTGTPSVHELTVRTESGTYSDPMIVTMSKNGSVFLLGENGKLRFTKSMGQPSATNFSPIVSDINTDNRQDIAALADFGRLYSWDVSSGNRIYPLPTTAMDHVIIMDIDEDGYKEVIAETREGLRCWTIYGSQQQGN